MLLHGFFPIAVEVSFSILLIAQALALILDQLFGEPRRFHPLVGFGRLSGFLESRFNSGGRPGAPKKAMGALAWLLAVVPLVGLCAYLLAHIAAVSQWWFWAVSIVVLYFTLGLKSLKQHADWVAEPLRNGDLAAGREKVSWLVSRHTEQMDASRITKACIESVLENGSDAVYGALFWFIVAGAPGALMYRLVNTLDACWGYKNERFRDFGYCAARMDDLFNLFPARICSLAYSLCGNTRNAFESWRRITHWRKTEGIGIGSPNAGIVMASGAGALNLSLGGAAVYGGEQVHKPELGSGKSPDCADICRAQRLLDRSLMLFLAAQVLIVSVLMAFFS